MFEIYTNSIIHSWSLNYYDWRFNWHKIHNLFINEPCVGKEGERQCVLSGHAVMLCVALWNQPQNRLFMQSMQPQNRLFCLFQWNNSPAVFAQFQLPKDTFCNRISKRYEMQRLFTFTAVFTITTKHFQMLNFRLW